MEFTDVLDKLANTACIPFYGSDIVMVKYQGEFIFFEKNLPSTCKRIEPRIVISTKSTAIASDRFTFDILKKFYKNCMRYDEYLTRRNYGLLREYNYPILSTSIAENYSRPPFYYIPVWVHIAHNSKEAIEAMKAENIVPQVSEIKYLDDTPVPELIRKAFADFGQSAIDIFRRIFIGSTKKATENTPTDQLEKSLLECDTDRCGLPKYEKLMLSDPNQGHWDVFEDKDKQKCGFKARDPKQDINKCVVGIDFGTRSTVVYYRNTANQILPIAVGGGKGSYDSKERYENPTIMHFISYEKFFKAYKAKEGRPDTKWKDLNVAHQAKGDFLEKAKSVEYCQYLYELKQWASRNGTVAVEDADGVAKDLPPFLQIDANDFNPIEVYAYYIGLFINRLNPPEKNIYFTYYLSFPYPP
ncbi:MAG: hypothetical protein II852_11040 [Bacteroidales bacterium]|nr:hypothetical protein [Bacteroidales bacterium]